MRKPTLILATTVTALILTSGAALAATVNCEANSVCVGTSGEDRMRGSAEGGEDMSGLEGGDVLRGFGGFDFLNGGPGVDLLAGGADGDSYIFKEAWKVDTVTDRSGFDSFDFSFITVPVEANLAPGAGGPAVRSETNRVYISSGSVIEQVVGGLDNDRILGNGAGNSLEGSESNDEINGRGGADGIGGGRGDDKLTGGPGHDIVVARSGNDTVYLVDGDADEVSCGTGADTVHFDVGLDTVDGNCETLNPPS